VMLRGAVGREFSNDVIFRVLARQMANRAGVVKMADGVMTKVAYYSS
jgi:hypothetical protein